MSTRSLEGKSKVHRGVATSCQYIGRNKGRNWPPQEEKKKKKRKKEKKKKKKRINSTKEDIRRRGGCGGRLRVPRSPRALFPELRETTNRIRRRDKPLSFKLLLDNNIQLDNNIHSPSCAVGHLRNDCCGYTPVLGER